MKLPNINYAWLFILLCAVSAKDAFADGCTNSDFTLTYSPFCGCWQLCGGQGNTLLISDCDDLDNLSIDWGDGTPAQSFQFGGAFPCHQYAQPGNYTVTMHIEGYCKNPFFKMRCSKSKPITVTEPTVNFDANFRNDTVCQGQVTNFFSTSVISPGLLNVNWFYDFGDGQTSIGNPNPDHYYNQCGAYDVMLIITANMLCCPTPGRDTIIKRIYVDCPPNSSSNALGLTDPYIYESSASVTMNEVCLTDATNFNLIKHDSITSWTYTFADGGSSTLLNPSHTFSYCPPFINWTRVALTNTRGCTSVLDTLAVVNCSVIANFAGTTGTLCTGDCNGTASINITGGTPNYTVQWGTTPPQTTLTATGLCPGSYDVTVTDNKGCRDTLSLNVFSPNPFVGTITATDIACNGWLTGTAVINMTGGTPPNTFYWSPGGDTSQIASGLAPGAYSVTATDANGCTFTTSTSIGEPPPITATFTHTDSHCGACDGTATVTPGGGTAPYTFFWPATGQTTAAATGLCSGIYFVQVTDSTPGCMLQFPVAIGNIGAAPVTVTTTDVTCASSCDGTATASIAGCPACTYEWLEANGTILAQTTSTATNLCAGAYIARVTNPADGCQSLTNFSITVPNPITLTTSATGISCNNMCDGQVSVTVSGGTPNYSYQWRDASNVLVGTTPVVGSLCPGTYTVQVTDIQGCVDTGTATVATYVFTGITNASAISCFGDCNAQILATPQIGTPPYSFQWDSAGTPIGTNNPILANLCFGTYNVRITDATGCAITLPPVIVAQPSALTATPSSTAVICNGDCTGTTSVTGAGGTPGYTYQWADSTIFPMPSATAATYLTACAGLYYIQITDTNNCKSPWTPVTVAEPDSLAFTIRVIQPYCTGGGAATVDLTVTGGTGSYTYIWSTGATTEDLTGITSLGLHCVTITDGNACSTSGCVDIRQAVPMTDTIYASGRNGYNLDCAGDTTARIYLLVNGGYPPYSYQWSPAGPDNDTLFFVAAGTYYVTITDTGGCSITDSITITQPPPLVHTAVVAQPLCPGDSTGSIRISPSGGVPMPPPQPYIAHWLYLTDTSRHINDTTMLLSSLIAGEYAMVVYDTNGCYSRDTFLLVYPQPIDAAFSIVNGACAGGGTGSIDMTPSGGTPATIPPAYTYAWTWSNGGASTSEDLNGLSPDSYFVTITDSNLCQIRDTAVVIEPLPLEATISAVDASCFGGSDGRIDVVVTGGSPIYMFSWNLVSDTTEDLIDIASGNYLVTVTDQGGCMDTVGIFVGQPAPIFGSGSITLCDGDSIFLGGNWRTTPNSYLDTAITAAGCDSFVTVTLGFVPFYEVNRAVIICTGDTFFLSNGDFYTTPGTYPDTLIASGGCDSIISTAVDVFQEIGVSTDPADVTTIVIGESVPINVLTTSGLTVTRYEWTPIDGLSCTDCPSTIAAPEVPITYTVTAYVDVNDSLTCSGFDTIRVLIDQGVLFYIPNAFTPNGDGVNDFFMVYGRGFETFRLKIYDRWGEKVFESYDQNIGWDGTYRGKALNPGVFVYHVDVDFIDKTKPDEYQRHWKGSVTLIR